MPAVDEGLDERVDGPLDGRSDEDRLEVIPAFKRFGRLGPVTGCVARRHTCLKMVPASRPPGVEPMRPIGGSRSSRTCLLLVVSPCVPPGRLILVLHRCECGCRRCGCRYRLPGVLVAIIVVWVRSLRPLCTSSACLVSALSMLRESWVAAFEVGIEAAAARRPTSLVSRRPTQSLSPD